MPVAITALYTAILALVALALAANVSIHRGKLKIDIGDGDNPQMLRMIRIHANAIEYLPMALLLMGVYELDGGSHRTLHIAGIALIGAPLLHAWGMWSRPELTFGRIVGVILTLLTITVLAILNLLQVA
jgi:uncharacterized membrane protein YecN with MAPEG domain